jgi:hypothetical protein
MSESKREPGPSVTGPGYVQHLVDPSGSGLHACDGQPFDPIPDSPGTVIYPCTGCTVVGPKLAEERKLANLGNASTRQMLEELEVRGQMHGGMDGRRLATEARRLLSSPEFSLAPSVLHYSTTGVAETRPEPASADQTVEDWHGRMLISESGYFTASGCNWTCAAKHTTPQQALDCDAKGVAG